RRSSGHARNFRGYPPNPVIGSFRPIAANEVSRLQLLDHSWQVGRIVLQIAVQRRNHWAGAGLESRPQRRTLSAIAAMSQPAHTRVFSMRALNVVPDRVGAAVINENDFIT